MNDPAPDGRVPISLDDFERSAIPRAQWTHRAHLTIAWLYLREHPFDEALARMRRGIKALNAANGVEDSLTSGYHETLTAAWLRIIGAMIRAHGPGDSIDAFLERHACLLDRYLLRLYYTRDRIVSREAKERFVEPDIAPLPR